MTHNIKVWKWSYCKSFLLNILVGLKICTTTKEYEYLMTEKVTVVLDKKD